MQATKKQPPKKQESSSSEAETESDKEMEVGGKKVTADSSGSEDSSDESGDQEEGVGLKLGTKRQRSGTFLYPMTLLGLFLCTSYRFKQQRFLFKTPKG